MRAPYIWILILLGSSSQKVFAKQNTMYIIPMAFGADSYIQTATFIKSRVAMTACSVDSPEIERVTFFFEVLGNNNKNVAFKSSKVTLKFDTPLTMMVLPDHLLPSRYIVPINLTSEEKIAALTLLRITIHDTGIFEIIATPVSVNGEEICISGTKPGVINLGAPVTGIDKKGKNVVFAVVRKFTIATDCFKLLFVNNSSVIDRKFLRTISTDKNDDIIANPKFMVPISWDEDKHMYISFFIHTRVGVIKHPDPNFVELYNVENVKFHFNILDATFKLQEISIEDLAVFDGDRLVTIVLSINILQEETQIIKPIEVSDMYTDPDEGNFYLCGLHTDQETFNNFLACDWIEEMAKNGIFESSKSTPTEEDVDSIVVYKKSPSSVKTIVAGITMEETDSKQLSAIVATEYRYYNTLRKFIGVTMATTKSYESDNIRSLKRFLMDKLRVSATFQIFRSHIGTMQAALKELKIGMLTKSGLYRPVCEMLAYLKEIENSHRGFKRFMLDIEMIEQLKDAMTAMEKFIFLSSRKQKNPLSFEKKMQF